MPPTLKHRIIELLSRDQSPKSISDIARKLGVAYSHAHSFVRQLVSENIIVTHKIGNVLVCGLDLSQPLTCSHLALIESARALEWRRKNPQSSKIMERIAQVQDSVHAVLIKNNNIVIVVPERVSGADFSVFKNRTVITAAQLQRRRSYYLDCVVLHGAEKFWSLLGGG